jgi:hypothetical protein
MGQPLDCPGCGWVDPATQSESRNDEEGDVTRTIQISNETIRLVESAVKDHDPLYATVEQNTPAMLACWAIHCVLSRGDVGADDGGV